MSAYTGEQHSFANTDPRGQATLEVAAGSYHFLADAEDIAWEAKEPETIAPGERRTVEITLVRWGVLRVAVMGATSPEVELQAERPGVGVQVHGFDLDAAGRAEIKVRPGPIDVRIVSRAEPLSSAAQSIVIEPGVVREAAFQLAPWPTFVVGHVRVAGDGRPVAGAEVWFSGGGGSATTDEAGAFTLRAPMAPENGICAHAPGFFITSVTFASDTAWPAEATIELRPEAKIIVSVTYRTGEPVQGALIAVATINRSARTYENGQVDFYLEPGRYEVSFDPNGEGPAPPPQIVEVGPGEDKTLRFTLSK